MYMSFTSSTPVIHLRRIIERAMGRTPVRFLVIGTSNSVVSFSTFWLAINSPVSFTFKVFFSQLLSYAIATLWGFYWHRRVTFKSKGSAHRQLTNFVLLQGSLALISAALIETAVGRLKFGPAVSWVTVMTAITILNYVICRRCVFRD
jgi:putative flippase GtrA